MFFFRNLAFNSSMVLEGEAYCLVIRTGSKTVIGKIATFTSSSKRKQTTLEKEITRFVKIIASYTFYKNNNSFNFY